MAKNRIQGITVEIGGDTTQLSKALQEPNKELRSLQDRLRSVNQALKLDPKNTDLLAQKQRLLAESVEKTEDKLSLLKQAQKEFIESGQDIDGENYVELERQIAVTADTLKKLKKEQDSLKFENLNKVAKKFDDVGNKLENTGKKVSVVSAGVGALGVASTKTAADFESSMSQVQATMGITKDALSEVNGESVNTMDALSGLAKKMGAETSFSASECADALNYLALAGYDTQQMFDTLPIVLNLAAAGNIDLAAASDMVTDAMSALGMETSQADMMVDQMAKTASNTNTSVAQLGEGILSIGATAKDVKGGTAELNTALGILANNGIKGAEGGTHLRNVILSLQNPVDKAADQMEALGLSVYDSEGNMRSLNDILGDLNASMEGMTSEEKSNIISKIFNKTDLASVNALLANTGDSWDKLQSSIENSGGAAQQMADTQLDNLSGQVTILKSAVEGLSISLGEILAPIIKSIVKALQQFVDWLNSLDQTTKTVIVVIGALITALGPVLIFVGKVAQGISSIITLGIKLSPIISKIGTVATTVLGTLKTTAIGAFGAIRTSALSAFSVLKTIGLGVLSALKTAALSAFGVLKTVALGAFNAILAHPIIAGIAAIIAIIVALYTKCEWFRDGVNQILTAVWKFVCDVFENIKNFLTVTVPETIANIINWFAELPGNLWKILTTAVSRVVAWGSNLFSAGVGAARKLVSSVVEGIASLPGKILEIGKDLVRGLWNGISEMGGWLWDKITGWAGDILGGIGSFFGIHSPSTVMRDYIGKNLVAGMGEGILKNAKMALAPMEKLVDDMTSTISPNMNAQVTKALNYNGTVTVEVPMQIDLDGKPIYKNVTRRITRNQSNSLAFRGG